MRLSFSPYLYKSAQPPWGGNSFRYPRSCPFVYYPEFTTIGESGTLVRGFRLSTWLWLQHTFPVRQPHNCRGSSSARLFSPKRCRRCLGWGKSGHLCIDCCLRLLAPEEPMKTRHHWSQPASFKQHPDIETQKKVLLTQFYWVNQPHFILSSSSSSALWWDPSSWYFKLI